MGHRDEKLEARKTWRSVGRDCGAGPVFWSRVLEHVDVSRALENLGARARLALECPTLLASQELAPSEFVPACWQGVIGLTGKKNGSPVSGVGYFEMTGYDCPVEALR